MNGGNNMKRGIRVIGMILLLAALLSMFAYAENEASPYSSTYLTRYEVSLERSGTALEIWFDVTGRYVLPEIGTKTIVLQRSADGLRWTPTKVFSYTDYTNMLVHNQIQHISHVTHTDVSWQYYRAYVAVYGGDGTNGDTRYVYTNTVQIPTNQNP